MFARRLLAGAWLPAALVAFVACTTETATPRAAPAEPAAAGDDGSDTDQSTDTNEPQDSSSQTDAGKPDAKSGKPDAGKPDASCTTKRWYRDSDFDGHGDPAKYEDACDAPSGYVADNTDCDDTKASVKPGAVELCDTVDNDCNGTINGTPTEAAACTSKAGSYAGTFSLYTAEKVGSTVVNQMSCTGTTTITIALDASVVVKGTTTCSYAGHLGGFDATQTGTIEATLRPDGTVEGTLSHKFDAFDPPHTFTIKGTAQNSRIDVTSTGSWYPNAMSAVPWDVTITIAAPKS